MAKIGNETKLVLKLAAEKTSMNEVVMRGQHMKDSNYPTDFDRGFVCGARFYEDTLDHIVRELESGK